MTELHDALDRCLEAMARGASIDNAVKRYPRLARELRPLLEASLLARDARRVHVPLDVRRRGRERLLEQVHPTAAQRPRARLIPVFPRLALTAVLVAALVLTSTGLVSASSTSLPGQQLYPVKRTWESVRLLLAFSTEQRDLIESDYEQERLDEIDQLLGKRMSAPISFSGLLAKQTDGTWTVSGIPVAVGSTTVLPQTAVTSGAPITVTGITRSDGVVEATQIQALQPGSALPPFEPSEDREHQGEDSSGSGASPTAPPGPTAAPTPPVPSGSEGEHSTFSFSGVVQSMQGNVWRINGQPVYMDSAQIGAQVTVGSIVKFQGYYAADGRFIVTSIDSQSGSSGGKHNDSSGSGDSEGEGGDGH